MSPWWVADGAHVTLHNTSILSTLKAIRLRYYCMDPTVRHAASASLIAAPFLTESLCHTHSQLQGITGSLP